MRTSNGLSPPEARQLHSLVLSGSGSTGTCKERRRNGVFAVKSTGKSSTPVAVVLLAPDVGAHELGVAECIAGGGCRLRSHRERRVPGARLGPKYSPRKAWRGSPHLGR